MNLLLDELDVMEVVGNPRTVEVSQVEHDSRRVRPGALFCCLPGGTTDGHDHAPAAVASGAVGLLCEHLVALGPGARPVQVRVAPGSVRPAMAAAAAAFFGHPARSLTTVGVTGTNGKTTVTHLVGAVLGAAGTETTVIGTLSGTRTTPEATELQAILAGERDHQDASGAKRAVAMEVSSHALVQSRVDGIRFDVAVFTNLGHDHLDFHGTMEEYFAAKASLFVPERAARAVVWTGTEWGQRLAASAPVQVTPVGPQDAADVRGGPGWSEFTWREHAVTLALTGRVNVVNALLAAEAAVALGVEPADVARGLGEATDVPGRLQVVAAPGAGTGPGSGAAGRGAEVHDAPYTVLVDYAHTPDALEVVLTDARRLIDVGRRVLVVFGAGGDRDHGKRPEMGAVASRLSDVVVLTSDNPRSEDPAAIAAAIRVGAEGPAEIAVVLDRRQAIAHALALAGPGDVVVVAGKGHEDYQEIGGRRIELDDRAVVIAALEAEG